MIGLGDVLSRVASPWKIFMPFIIKKEQKSGLMLTFGTHSS